MTANHVAHRTRVTHEGLPGRNRREKRLNARLARQEQLAQQRRQDRSYVNERRRENQRRGSK